jgi:hypothetical protein
MRFNAISGYNIPGIQVPGASAEGFHRQHPQAASGIPFAATFLEHSNS